MKVSPADYELFESEVSRWMDFWGLTEWDIGFNHENPYLKDVDASTRCSYEDKWAVVGLTDNIHDYEYSKEFIGKCAFHEVAELLLAELVMLTQMRSVTREDIVRATHCIIMRLQNTIWKESNTAAQGRITISLKAGSSKERRKRSAKILSGGKKEKSNARRT